MFNRKSSSNGGFSMAMLVYQSVYKHVGWSTHEWKLCSSNWIISPRFWGWKLKKIFKQTPSSIRFTCKKSTNHHKSLDPASRRFKRKKSTDLQKNLNTTYNNINEINVRSCENASHPRTAQNFRNMGHLVHSKLTSKGGSRKKRHFHGRSTKGFPG